MSKNFDYILENTTGVLHWINRKDFVDNSKSILNDKINNNAVLFVSCNSYKSLDQCIKYLKTETNQDFDIIIVDNSTNTEEINSIQSLCTNKKINVIKPIENIGGSGGFSIGMEYIISKNYDNVICFEDDIIPIDKDIITSTLNMLKKEKIAGNIIYGTKGSAAFHLTGYSIELLNKKVGVVDPRFFLKYDDRDIQKRYGSRESKPCTKKLAFHPLMKKNMWKPRVLSITVRNCLFYAQKYPKEIFIAIRDLFIYVLYGLSFKIITGQNENLHATLYGIYSFLMYKPGLHSNKKILNKFLSKTLNEPCNVKYFVGDVEDSNKLLNDKYYLYGKLSGNYEPLYGNLNPSSNFLDHKNGIVMLGYLSPFFWFQMFFKNIFFLDEYNFEEKRYHISILTNQVPFRFLKLILSLLLSIIICIPTSIVVMIKSISMHILNFK